MTDNEIPRCEIPSNRKWRVTYNHLFQITPEEAKAIADLDANNDVWEFFLQDLFQAFTMNEQDLIDVGWYPEGSPDGHYHIVLIPRANDENIHDWHNPLVEFDTRSLDKLLFKLRVLMSKDNPI